MNSCAVNPQTFKVAIVKLTVIVHLPTPFLGPQAFWLSFGVISLAPPVAALVAVLAAVAAAVVVLAAAAPVGDHLASRPFRGRGHLQLVVNHLRAARYREHGDSVARDADYDRHPFEGSHPGRIS